MCFAPQRRALFHISTSKSRPTLRCFLHFDFEMCFAPQRHFFDIATSKSGPKLVCFVHFDFEMCFAPQRHALFRHLNCGKWPGPGVVLYILTWKCASRHNGVQFFISHLASWLRTRRFSEPTFRPSGATNHWKNTVNRDFPTFSRISIFSLLIFLFSLPLPCSAFHLSILSEVWLLNFLRSLYIYIAIYKHIIKTYIYLYRYIFAQFPSIKSIELCFFGSFWHVNC